MVIVFGSIDTADCYIIQKAILINTCELGNLGCTSMPISFTMAALNANKSHATLGDESGNNYVKSCKLTHSQQLIQNSQDVQGCVQIPCVLRE